MLNSYKNLFLNALSSTKNQAMQAAREGDIILVAGKGHETYQDINGTLFPYSDKEVILSLSS